MQSENKGIPLTVELVLPNLYQALTGQYHMGEIYRTNFDEHIKNTEFLLKWANNKVSSPVPKEDETRKLFIEYLAYLELLSKTLSAKGSSINEEKSQLRPTKYEENQSLLKRFKTHIGLLALRKDEVVNKDFYRIVRAGNKDAEGKDVKEDKEVGMFSYLTQVLLPAVKEKVTSGSDQKMLAEIKTRLDYYFTPYKVPGFIDVAGIRASEAKLDKINAQTDGIKQTLIEVISEQNKETQGPKLEKIIPQLDEIREVLAKILADKNEGEYGPKIEKMIRQLDEMKEILSKIIPPKDKGVQGPKMGP